MSSSTIAESEQRLCKNRCGYYGNSAWDGLCSRCWQEKQNSEPNNQHAHRFVNRSGISEHKFLGRPSIRRKILQKLRENYDIVVYPSHRASSSDVHVPEREIELKILRFLNRKRFKAVHAITPEFYSTVGAFVDSIYHYTNRTDEACSIDVLSEKFRQFYAHMEQWIEDNFAGFSSEQQELLFNSAEDCIFQIMYGSLFSAIYADCEHNDCEMYKRLESLHWVKPEMLGIQVDGKFWKVNSSAVEAITKIDSEITPLDKLSEIVSCLKLISAEDFVHEGGADDLLPKLIFALISARPVRIKTNLAFISVFSEPDRLTSGQFGYAFTTMDCAIHYIEHLGPSSLGITEKEFDRYMHSRPSDGFNILKTAELARRSDAIVLFEENESAKSYLIERQNKLSSRISALYDSMLSYYNWLANELSSRIGLSNQIRPLRSSEEEICLDDICDVIDCLENTLALIQ